VPEFPADTALIALIGAVAAIAAKILLGKKRAANAPLVPKPPRTADTKVHTAATAIVQERFEEKTSTIEEANDDEDTEKRLKTLSDLANVAKRR
tara:strand:+ start:1943 stop:2224 length:282 start_codon:yes stop_codon:yes gene_type:complete